TGSLIVYYEPSALRSPKLLADLAEQARGLIPGIEPESLVRAWLSGNGRWPDSGELHARGLGEAIGTVNEGVAAVTGGIDLKLLVPFALLFFGVRSLILEPLARPAW